jgi:acyl-coenzyme A synthetase/AMP-(fatty) acid ligase
MEKALGGRADQLGSGETTGIVDRTVDTSSACRSERLDLDGLTRIRAFIVLKGAQATAELGAELQEHSKSRLQRFQYPHDVVFVEDLPKTVTGKIQRYKLRSAGP